MRRLVRVRASACAKRLSKLVVRSTSALMAVEWTLSMTEEDSDCPSWDDVWSPYSRGIGEGERTLPPIQGSVWTARSRVKSNNGFWARGRSADMTLLSWSS